MNGRQIEIFHAIMHTGTVTEAAVRLGISQPAVTASLKQMESGLGFNLFHRKGGRLHPTSEAKILNGEANRIQDSLMVFKNLANRLKKDLTTHLRVATPPTFGHDLIPEAIAQFTQHSRDCLMDVSIQHHSDILKDVASSVGQNSLGITFGLDGNRNLGSITIGSADIVALVPSDWGIATQKSLPISAFADKPLIGTFAGEPLGNAVEALLRTANINPDFSIRVHTHSIAANLAGKGVGATIVDSVTATHAMVHHSGHGFTAIAIEDAPSLPITAVFSYEHPLNKHAKQFVDIFKQCLTKLCS